MSGPGFAIWCDPRAQRNQHDKAERFFKVPLDVGVEPVQVGSLAAEWLRPAGARADATVLYLHGGGYAIGSRRPG